MKFGRIGYSLAAVVASAVLVVTITSGPGGGGGGSTTANLWVTTTGNDTTCARSGSLIALGSSSPCRTLGKAYALASASGGDIIRIENGSYSGDTLAYRSDLAGLVTKCDPYGEWGSVSTSTCTKIIPDGGNIIYTGSLAIEGSDVWIAGTATGSAPALQNRSYNILIDSGGGSDFTNEANHGAIEVYSPTSGQSADHVIIEGVHSHTFTFLGGDHIDYRNSEAGPNTQNEIPPYGNGDCDDGQNVIQYSGNNVVPISNVVLDGILVYRQSANDNNGDGIQNCHSGGLIFNTYLDTLTIKNSVWLNNANYDIQADVISVNKEIKNVTIQNNVFGCAVEAAGLEGTCTEREAIELKGLTLTNWLIRYNSIYSYVRGWSSPTYSSFRMVGNILEVPGSSVNEICSAGVTIDYNVWLKNLDFNDSGVCGDTHGNGGNLRGGIWTTPGSATAPDFHLLNGTNVANNFVVPTTSDYALTIDYEGNSRPAGANRDAGADEQ